MSKYIGRQVSIGLAKEAVRGTAESTPTFFEPQLELTLDEKITQAINESAVNRIEDAQGASVTEKMTIGSLRGIVQTESIGLWLLASIGAVSTSVDDPEAGVNTHTFSVLNSAQHPSLTIFEKNPDQDRAYALAVIETFELAVNLNEFITFTAGFRAKKGEGASTTVSFTDQTRFIPQFAGFKTATDLSGLGAAPLIKVKQFTLTITKNAEDDRNFGSTDPDDILNKQFVVEGSVELLFDSATFQGLVIGDTAQAMRIELENTDVTIGASSSPKLTIDLAKVKFSEITRGLDNNELTRQTLTFKGFYSLADAKSIEVKLINTTASY